MADQVTRGRFVGRTQELAWLRQLLTRAADGESLVALVGGEAGVGKTRLVEQLAAAAGEQGVRVLGGGCVPLGEEGVPFAPVTQALRGLADQLDPAELETVAGPARQELARLLPDLAVNGVVGATAEVAAGAGQGRLFELLLGVVQRLTARAPLLWVVEDLHWADRSTRDLLAFLATALRSGRVMVVGTFRSDELHRRHPLHGLLGQLGRNRRVVRLQLERFNRAELAAQLAGLLGADPPARLVDDIYARSQGNPFFAEELLLAGASDGGGRAALPPSLREVLLTRVVRLGDRTQQLLGVAAAAGPGVTQPLLAAVAGLDDRQLLDGLHEAVDQQLLLPDPAGGAGYLFRHALLAEAVYSELLAGERVRLHTALAGALEAGLEAGEAPASRAARLAYHWWAAGDQPRALTASIQAASAAEGVYAFAEAQLQLERALALWDRVADAAGRAGMDRVGLLSRCGEAAYGAGDLAGAAELVRQALGLVDAARQPLRAGLLHEQLARCLRRLRDPAALDEHQQAVRLVPPEPSTERAWVLGSLAQYLVTVDRFAEARGPAEEAIATAAQVGARAEEAIARTALGGALIYLGEPDAGLAELAAAGRLAAQTGDVIVVLRTLVSRSDGLNAAGRPEEAVVVALDGLQQARRLGLVRGNGPVLAANAAEALFALGRWDQAEQVSREGLEISPSGAAYNALPVDRAALELGRGDLDAAQARLQAMRRLLPSPIPGAENAGPLFGGLAELALWRGDLDQAKQLVSEAVPLVESNPRYAAPLYALGVRVEADRAELARARHPHQPAPDDGTGAALLERLQATAAGGLPELAAWHATAHAESTRQQGRPDPAAWAAAVAAWERLGQPYRVAYAGFRHAEALLGGGDRDRATTVLGRAAEVTGRLGARPLDREIQALGRRARLDLAPPTGVAVQAAGAPTPAAQLGLTSREVEVLALVAAGRSNRQIAQALFISPKTVGVHVSNILAKLGVAGRVEAAAIAHRLGLD
jgi:DNA-binding CsgD family transcriptional regulator/tetratricopeptide (TPR) repeat protein